jgi:hypothetical protein
MSRQTFETTEFQVSEILEGAHVITLSVCTVK